MSRCDSPGQTLLLFTGAAMVSVVLILLLDAEARSRKLHKDPEIRNGNLFSTIGHKVVRLVSGWAHHNLTNSSADAVVITATDFRRGGRSLQSVAEEAGTVEPLSAAPQHKVRHSKSRRKPVAPAEVPPPPPATQAPDPTPLPAPVPRRRVGPHDACYNTNEVLLIIAITCAVNFAFIFVIMALVHVCNRNNKVAVISGMDSLVLADNGDCASLNERGSQKLTLLLTSNPAVAKLCESTSYNSVQEYVNSLPTTMVDRDYACDRTSSMLSLHNLDPAKSNFQDSTGRTCQTDMSKRRSSHNLQTAFSMEDLLFMD